MQDAPAGWFDIVFLARILNWRAGCRLDCGLWATGSGYAAAEPAAPMRQHPINIVEQFLLLHRLHQDCGDVQRPIACCITRSILRRQQDDPAGFQFRCLRDPLCKLNPVRAGHPARRATEARSAGLQKIASPLLRSSPRARRLSSWASTAQAAPTLPISGSSDSPRCRPRSARAGRGDPRLGEEAAAQPPRREE